MDKKYSISCNIYYNLKIPEYNIFNYSDNFEVKINMATKGKGVAIILNCLSGQDFYGSIRSIGPFGTFFQMSKTDMKNKEKFGNIILLLTTLLTYLSKYLYISGMLVFLKVVTFYTVSSDGLLAENSEVKLKIQNEVQKGIDLGIIKPFKRHVLTGPCTREQAIKTL